jgi:signal transduction histidine kinase
MKKDFNLFLKIMILLIFFVITTNEGFAQIQVTDSLTRVISGQAGNPGKVDNLILLARTHFSKNQLDSALYFSDKALDLASRLNYLSGQGDAFYMKSLINRSKGDIKASMSNADKYLEIFLRVNDSLRLAKGYYQLGNLHKDLGNYEQALFYCQKSLSYAIPLKKSDIILGNYVSMGSIYFDGKSKNDSAAGYYLKALDISEKTGNQSILSIVLNNLGNVYLAEDQNEIAKKYLNMSLEINKKFQNDKMMALNFSNLGRAAIKEDKFGEAMSYYDQAMKLYVKLGDERGTSEINNSYGDVFFKQQKYDKALEKFDNALDGFREISYTRGIISASINKAAVYSEQGKTDMAKALQDSAIAVANSIGGKDLLIFAYRNMADNYFKARDFNNAYKYRLQYEGIYDSVYQIEKTKSFNTLMLQYEQGKNKARILELEKENLQKTNQRNAFMFTVVGILAIALFIVIYFRQRVAHEKVVARQKILQLEEEKKLMAAKILVEGQEEERKRIATELHDGLGVLLSATKMQFSTISDKSPENKGLIEKATRMLEQASGDVRKISHNMMPGLLTKLGFYEAVEDLFEGIDDAGDLNAVCSITGSQERLPENKEIMLYRIVQEMVNNTLKHAEAGNIDIRISEHPGFLDINYSDDGKGFDVSQKLESESLGLQSIQSRIDFLNGMMNLKSEPGKGVRYDIRIPV